MNTSIAVVGLGYVGLPLAVEFSKHFETVGFDISARRIEELSSGVDKTLEVSEAALNEALKTHGLSFTTSLDAVAKCNTFIVTVPTPIDEHKQPDLRPLIGASELVGKVLKPGDLVIYESTVFPGATEEECVPVLERESGLSFNEDFVCGYSPERINPGDKEHTVTKILKVTSGSTPEAGERVDALYRTIIEAGTHLAPSIKVAEAAKVIENAQRDINIAFVNELSIIFNKLGIDTSDVLEAAGTKWNFLPFRPGLVGGHCIGVDPYYLAQKALDANYNPEIILAGRRLNDNMGSHIAGRVIKLMIKKRIAVDHSRVLMLGITFKENCPDIRNSHVVDVIRELEEFGCDVDVTDPWADADEVKRFYGYTLLKEARPEKYDAVILAVAHDAFKSLKLEKREGRVIYDIKSALDRDLVDGRL